MRKDDGVDGDAQRIGQLTWMLFLKIFDQCEEEWEFEASDSGGKYKSPIPEEYRWRNWAGYLVDNDGKRKPRIAGSDLIPHVTKLFENIKELPLEAPDYPKRATKATIRDLLKEKLFERSFKTPTIT